MPNEIGQENYRKLLYYYNTRIMVHFKDRKGIWYNGEILNLDEEKLTMVLKERVRGEIPFILEQVNPDSIAAFKEKEDEIEFPLNPKYIYSCQRCQETFESKEELIIIPKKFPLCKRCGGEKSWQV